MADDEKNESTGDFGASESVIIAAQRSTAQKIWNHRFVMGFVRYPPAFVALIIASFFLFFALFAPFIVSWDPNKPVLADTLQPPEWGIMFNSVHVLGTDTVGRDIFVRTLMGGRTSILLGFTGATGALSIGVVLGMIAGWKRGVIGATIMRWADLQIALPLLLMALTVAAVFGPGLHILLILFSLWFWGPYARISEGLTL